MFLRATGKLLSAARRRVFKCFTPEITKHTAGHKISGDQSASVSELTDVSLDGDLLVPAGEAVVELRTGGQTERPLRWSCHV